MEPLLALLVIIYKVALQQLAFGSQHIQSVHGIRSIEVQIGHELIGGERTMGFGVTGHATSHIIVGKFIPESALPQFLFDFANHVRIQHLCHVGGAEQAFEHVRIERQQSRAALGLRLVILVHHHADEAKENVLGERRWRFGLHVLHGNDAGLQSGHHLVQGRHVVYVLQTFARGFQQQREVLGHACGLQELCGAQSLLP